MADEPILIGLSGATFLMTAETGGLIQSFDQEVTRKRLDVYDGSVGKTTGKVFHDPVATYNWRIIRTGGTGLGAASPGVAITLANSAVANGAPAGIIYTETVRRSHTAEGLLELSGTAVQHAV